jgi:hypothetical protein
MTGYDLVLQRSKAMMWQLYYESIGYIVINPFELADQLRKSFIDLAGREPTEAEYLHEDLMNLRICTDIFLCNGWTASYGCMEEVDISISLGLKYHFEANNSKQNHNGTMGIIPSSGSFCYQKEKSGQTKERMVE